MSLENSTNNKKSMNIFNNKYLRIPATIGFLCFLFGTGGWAYGAYQASIAKSHANARSYNLAIERYEKAELVSSFYTVQKIQVRYQEFVHHYTYPSFIIPYSSLLIECNVFDDYLPESYKGTDIYSLHNVLKSLKTVHIQLGNKYSIKKKNIVEKELSKISSDISSIKTYDTSHLLEVLNLVELDYHLALSKKEINEKNTKKATTYLKAADNIFDKLKKTSPNHHFLSKLELVIANFNYEVNYDNLPGENESEYKGILHKLVNKAIASNKKTVLAHGQNYHIRDFVTQSMSSELGKRYYNKIEDLLSNQKDSRLFEDVFRKEVDDALNLVQKEHHEYYYKDCHWYQKLFDMRTFYNDLENRSPAAHKLALLTMYKACERYQEPSSSFQATINLFDLTYLYHQLEHKLSTGNYNNGIKLYAEILKKNDFLTKDKNVNAYHNFNAQYLFLQHSKKIFTERLAKINLEQETEYKELLTKELEKQKKENKLLSDKYGNHLKIDYRISKKN